MSAKKKRSAAKAASRRRRMPARSLPTPPDPLRDVANDVVGLLDDTRSVFVVALRCLDNVDELDEKRIDAPVPCEAEDVAMVLRVGLAQLDQAREALQTRVVEGEA